MSSKAQKLKQKKMANAIRAQSAPTPDAKPDTVKRPPVQMHSRVEAIRPTVERLRKGAFRMPTGPERKSLPAVDEAHDVIAKLHRAALISDDQEQAARDWQDLKAAIRAELGVSQGRSCLDISPVGYGALDWTCVLGHRSANIDLFRVALDLFARY